MGIIMSIALHKDQAGAGEVFLSTLERLLRKGKLRSLELHERFHDGKAKNTFEGIHQLNEIVRRIPVSDLQLESGLFYQLPSGKKVYVDLDLTGIDYESGFNVQFDGYVRLTVSLGDVYREVISEIGGAYFFRKELASEQKKLFTMKEYQQAAEDWHELFLNACGLIPNAGQSLECTIHHAAMYFETVWMSPISCAMVYHSNKQEFGKDFLRIYRLYHYEDQLMTQLLDNNKLDRVADLVPTPQEEKLKRYPLYDLLDGYQNTLSKFMTELDFAACVELANLPIQEVDRLLNEAFVKVQDQEFNTFPLTYMDYKEQGAAILSIPNQSVWPMYWHMYQLYVS
jgi:hypothetical protein